MVNIKKEIKELEEQREQLEIDEDELEDMEIDRIEVDKELRQVIGSPPQEEQHGKHIFLKESTEKKEIDRFTNLNEEETGRPLFPMRFMMDMEDNTLLMLEDYLKGLEKEHNITIPEKVSKIWRRKIDNVASSGMSKDGFIQMMNITQKVDSVRQRKRDPIENLKGGRK